MLYQKQMIKIEGGTIVCCPPRWACELKAVCAVLDELNAFTPEMQKAFYGLILDRCSRECERLESGLVITADYKRRVRPPEPARAGARLSDSGGTLKPYSKYVADALFEVKERRAKTGPWVGTQTLITPKGREKIRLVCKKLQSAAE